MQLLQLRKEGLKKFQACTSAAQVSLSSRVRIPYKPESFFRLPFAAAKVVSITAMIYFHIILHPTVYIYNFHVPNFKNLFSYQT